jgi:hypothetical protein
MDFALEILMVFTALVVALAAAQRGRPGPSFLIAAVAALNAISFLIRPNPHGDMLLAWAIAAIALGIGLFGRRIRQRNQQVASNR